MTGRGVPWRPWQRQAWQAVNSSTAPVWLLMILRPRWDVTRRVVRATAPLHAGLGLAYMGFLGRSAALGTERINFFDGESVARGLANPDGMLAGWTHYLTFDLFVGEWIHATAQEEGIDARVALMLTWWAGPAGLTLFAWQRRRRRRRHG